MSKFEQLKQAIEKTEVAHTAFVSADGILYDPSFFDLCAQNSCGRFGTCHMCPPDVGPIEELIKKAKAYDIGLMYQTIASIEDSFDIEGMGEAKRVHNAVAQKIHAIVHTIWPDGGPLHLAAGGCGVCARCTKLDNLPCRFPEKAISSLEAYGVDVYRTCSNAGLRYVNGPNTVTYFGMVLLRENDDA